MATATASDLAAEESVAQPRHASAEPQPASGPLAGPDVETLEDPGLVRVKGWLSRPPGGAVIEVSNDNNALFLLQPAVSERGELSFQPAPHATGRARLRVQTRDGDQTSAPQHRVIAVSPVNDPPRFSLDPDPVIVRADAGPVRIEGVATRLAPGPVEATENSQSLTFLVRYDNPELFAEPPRLSSDGTLFFAPAPGKSGAAVVWARLRDDGGRAHDGIDTSAERAFAIVVLPDARGTSLTTSTDPQDPAPSFTALEARLR